MNKFARKTLALVLSGVMAYSSIGTAFAASNYELNTINNNSLMIGTHVFDLNNSDGSVFTTDNFMTAVRSIESKDNKVFYKFNNEWFEILEDTDFMSDGKAMTAADITSAISNIDMNAFDGTDIQKKSAAVEAIDKVAKDGDASGITIDNLITAGVDPKQAKLEKLAAYQKQIMLAENLAYDSSEKIVDMITSVNAADVVAVSAITVTGEASATTIETKGGTLQMTATPNDDATNKLVTWSVLGADDNATDLASISVDGLLTAVKDGTVTVIATAQDGSSVVGEMDVVVSGQMQEQNAPTETLTGVAPITVDNNDGKITGVTTAMEYKLSTATDYTAITGTEITELAAGTYNVRYAAKDGFNAGATKDVEVAEYEAPLSGTVTTTEYIETGDFTKGAVYSATVIFDGVEGTLAGTVPADGTPVNLTFTADGFSGSVTIATTFNGTLSD